MLKKLMYLMAASLMLFATSCENDVDVAPNAGEAAVVTFSVGTPEIVSRAYSDGTTATKLQYAVYNEAGQILPDLTKTDATINGSTNVKLQLTTGNTYSVIFWAAAPDAPYTVSFENKTMTVNYEGATCNDEKRDAFYKYHTFTVNGTQTETIELKRPFAQLNIGTSDYAASKSAGYVPTKSSVTVPVYNTLNLTDGTVVGQAAPQTFALADIKKDETFPVAGNEYLAMSYLLVDAEQELVDVEFVYTDGTNAKTRKVGSVPVKRNYRTNLYGKLLTSEVDINVEIVEDFDGEFDNEGYFVVETNASGAPTAVVVESAKGMATIANAIADGTIPSNAKIDLKGDIDLADLAEVMRSSAVVSNWTPIGTSEKPFTGTFDGKGYTIKNLVIDGGSKSYIGLFGETRNGEIKNLTIENAKVSGYMGVGVVAGQPYTSKYTNITVKGHVEVNGFAYVGGVGGRNAYANWENITVDVDETSYVRAHSVNEEGKAFRTYVGGVVGFNGEGGHSFKNIKSNIKVEGSTIDVGGLFGIAHYGNQFENCVCTGDVEIYAAEEEAAAQHIGGIAGVWNNVDQDVVMNNCSFTGTLKANNDFVITPKFTNLVCAAYNANGTGKLIIDGVEYMQTENGVTVNGLTPVATADELVAALKANEGVYLLKDIKIDPASMSNAYGTTGINVKNGQTIDGNGHTLDIKGAGGTWDSGINTTGGLIKNITVTGSFRGIFVNHNSDHSEKVVLENVTITGTTYTLSCDQGTNNGIEATNCTFNGWTSYAATAGEVKFVNCSFGEGSGYAFCRPYAKSEFVNCEFKNAYAFDTNAYGAKPVLAFKGCTYNGVAITAENATSLSDGEEVFLYNGLNNLTIE